MNHDAPPNRTCVTCKHAGLNQPANFPLVCRHPDSPVDNVTGWVSTCRSMRSLQGACGPHGDLWTERTPPTKRKPPFARVIRWFKGNKI